MINIIVELIELYCFENVILIKKKLLYKDQLVVLDKANTMLFVLIVFEKTLHHWISHIFLCKQINILLTSCHTISSTSTPLNSQIFK